MTGADIISWTTVTFRREISFTLVSLNQCRKLGSPLLSDHAGLDVRTEQRRHVSCLKTLAFDASFIPRVI